YASVLTHSFLTSGMPKAPPCSSNIVGGVQIYAGSCVIDGSSLTYPKIKLAAGTQIFGGWGAHQAKRSIYHREHTGSLQTSVCNRARFSSVRLVNTFKASG